MLSSDRLGTEPRLSNPPGSQHNSGARLLCFCIFLFSRRVGIVIAGLLGFSASAPISASYDDSPLHSTWRWLLTREFRGISDLSLRFGRDGILGVQCASWFSGSHTHTHTSHNLRQTHSCTASFGLICRTFIFSSGAGPWRWVERVAGMPDLVTLLLGRLGTLHAWQRVSKGASLLLRSATFERFSASSLYQAHMHAVPPDKT